MLRTRGFAGSKGAALLAEVAFGWVLQGQVLPGFVFSSAPPCSGDVVSEVVSLPLVWLWESGDLLGNPEALGVLARESRCVCLSVPGWLRAPCLCPVSAVWFGSGSAGMLQVGSAPSGCETQPWFPVTAQDLSRSVAVGASTRVLGFT